jgi:hypothetical protein
MPNSKAKIVRDQESPATTQIARETPIPMYIPIRNVSLLTRSALPPRKNRPTVLPMPIIPRSVMAAAGETSISIWQMTTFVIDGYGLKSVHLVRMSLGGILVTIHYSSNDCGLIKNQVLRRERMPSKVLTALALSSLCRSRRIFSPACSSRMAFPFSIMSSTLSSTL